jgi:hypothetical protein
MESHGRQLPGDPSITGRRIGIDPKPKAKIKVSIPVRLGGYTGQRDAWEEYERDFVVSFSGDEIVLESAGPRAQRITFSHDALREALRALGRTQPAYR